MDMKIRLAAIAKDEGAYLPEWIYWHLLKGFDDIYICINNSSDNSINITQSIALQHPVTIKSIDSHTPYGFNDDLIEEQFLKKNPLQSKLYADIYAQSYAEGFTHVMFLDIDEFLFSPKASIHQLVQDELDHDVILFNWFNISGENEAFSCLTSEMKGERSPFTKYIMKTGLPDIQFISTHNIRTTQSTKCLFGRGKTSENSNYLTNLDWCEDAFILHRHLRSQAEYLSLLSRGDTWDNSLIGLKNNRHGWSNIGTHTVSTNQNSQPENYTDGFKQFLSNCEIENQVMVAQQYILNRANKTKEMINKVQTLNRDLDRVLAGTDLRHVDRGLKYTLKRWYYQLMVRKNINNYY